MNITVVRSLKLFVMYCSSSFSYDELNNSIDLEAGDEVKLIALPCSGKVDLLYLMKAFEKGADGLVLLTCPEEKCHNLQGNLRAMKRAEGLNSIMEETGFGKERMRVIALKGHDIAGVVSEIGEFSSRIRFMNVNTSGVSVSDTVHTSC